jgi:phospholipid transport system substrate-binding protein
VDKRRRHKTLASIALGAAIGLTGFSVASIATLAEAAETEAARDQGAEQFVQAQGQRLVSILADKSQSPPVRISAFRAAVNEIADVPRIARFVLGKYARTITPVQMDRFGALFEDYAQNVFRQGLANFNADTLTVTGSLTLRPGEVVVKTTISSSTDEYNPPTTLSWRVLGSGSNWKVADVGVSGVWLAIAQQEDFVSTIDNHGGDIDALISRLEAQSRSSAAPPAAADR